mgnify:CR=1 FL=1
MFRRVVAGVLTAFALTTLAACSGEGSRVDCGLNGCAITLSRSGETSVSVLGVKARLIEVRDGAAEVEVAGVRVTVPGGGESEAGEFTVGVERITDEDVVVRIRPN